MTLGGASVPRSDKRWHACGRRDRPHMIGRKINRLFALFFILANAVEILMTLVKIANHRPRLPSTFADWIKELRFAEPENTLFSLPCLIGCLGPRFTFKCFGWAQNEIHLQAKRQLFARYNRRRDLSNIMVFDCGTIIFKATWSVEHNTAAPYNMIPIFHWFFTN